MTPQATTSWKCPPRDQHSSANTPRFCAQLTAHWLKILSTTKKNSTAHSSNLTHRRHGERKGWDRWSVSLASAHLLPQAHNQYSAIEIYVATNNPNFTCRNLNNCGPNSTLYLLLLIRFNIDWSKLPLSSIVGTASEKLGHVPASFQPLKKSLPPILTIILCVFRFLSIFFRWWV